MVPGRCVRLWEKDSQEQHLQEFKNKTGQRNSWNSCLLVGHVGCGVRKMSIRSGSGSHGSQSSNSLCASSSFFNRATEKTLLPLQKKEWREHNSLTVKQDHLITEPWQLHHRSQLEDKSSNCVDEVTACAIARHIGQSRAKLKELEVSLSEDLGSGNLALHSNEVNHHCRHVLGPLVAP